MDRQKQFDFAIASITVVALAISLFVAFTGGQKIAKLELALDVLTQGKYHTTTVEELKGIQTQINAQPINNQPIR